MVSYEQIKSLCNSGEKLCFKGGKKVYFSAKKGRELKIPGTSLPASKQGVVGEDW